MNYTQANEYYTFRDKDLCAKPTIEYINKVCDFAKLNLATINAESEVLISYVRDITLELASIIAKKPVNLPRKIYVPFIDPYDPECKKYLFVMTADKDDFTWELIQ